MKKWFEIENAGSVDSPALMIFPERVKENISRALEISSGAAFLRPHVKTHKIKEVAGMMLEAGIEKFKCATIAEAEMLASAGARDILLAYQPTRPKANRLLELSAGFPKIRFSCLIDNYSSALMLSEVFNGRRLEVFIDLNVGQNRTGIKPASAPDLYRECEHLGNILIAGLHAYDGHIHDSDLSARTEKAAEVFRITASVKETIEKAQGRAMTLVMGGTPTFPLHARQPGVETSPGTFVFWDEGYQTMLPDEPFSCAAVLLTRVISKVDEHTLCLDLGHKSVSAENPIQHRVAFPDHPEAEVLGQSEEHMTVRVSNADDHETGQVWYGIPYHICPTVALYESVHVIRDHRWTENWKVIARNRKINF